MHVGEGRGEGRGGGGEGQEGKGEGGERQGEGRSADGIEEAISCKQLECSKWHF